MLQATGKISYLEASLTEALNGLRAARADWLEREPARPATARRLP
jgi:hypothetical protein